MDMKSATPSGLTADQINELPPMDFEGEIILVTTKTQARKAIEFLKDEPILGFDTETRPSFKKGEFHHVALLQLATKNKAYLFHLCKAPMLPEVVELLASPDILKVGVATRDDVKALQKLLDFTPEGFIDIAKRLAAKTKNPGKTPGLRSLVAEYLGYRLSKGAKITNWEADKLSKAQIKYAAKDAVAGILIYQKLIELGQLK